MLIDDVNVFNEPVVLSIPVILVSLELVYVLKSLLIEELALSKLSNLPAAEELNVFNELVDVSIKPSLVFWPASVVAIELDKEPIDELKPAVVIATELDNEPILDDKLLSVVDNDELILPTLELTLLILVLIEDEILPRLELIFAVVEAIEPLNVLIEELTDELKLLNPVVPLNITCIEPDTTFCAANSASIVVLIDDVNASNEPVLISISPNLISVLLV